MCQVEKNRFVPFFTPLFFDWTISLTATRRQMKRKHKQRCRCTMHQIIEELDQSSLHPLQKRTENKNVSPDWDRTLAPDNGRVMGRVFKQRARCKYCYSKPQNGSPVFLITIASHIHYPKANKLSNVGKVQVQLFMPLPQCHNVI